MYRAALLLSAQLRRTIHRSVLCCTYRRRRKNKAAKPEVSQSRPGLKAKSNHRIKRSGGTATIFSAGTMLFSVPAEHIVNKKK
jgi:hypothetical protein